MESNADQFIKAVTTFGIDAALEYFDVPKERWEEFRKEIQSQAKDTPHLDMVIEKSSLGVVSKRCSDCGGDATIAMTSWKDNETGKQYYKKGERRCISCHKKHTGISFSFH